jgi:hypothetical protein
MPPTTDPQTPGATWRHLSTWDYLADLTLRTIPWIASGCARAAGRGPRAGWAGEPNGPNRADSEIERSGASRSGKIPNRGGAVGTSGTAANREEKAVHMSDSAACGARYTRKSLAGQPSTCLL